MTAPPSMSCDAKCAFVQGGLAHKGGLGGIALGWGGQEGRGLQVGTLGRFSIGILVIFQDLSNFPLHPPGTRLRRKKVYSGFWIRTTSLVMYN